MRGRQVVHFRAVLFHVVEFPWSSRALGHEFPGAGPQGPVPLVFPEEGVPLNRLALEGGHEAAPFHGPDRLAVELRRVLRPGYVHARGHDVDQVARLMFQLAATRDPRGPMGNQGGGNPALVHKVLVEAKRRVAHVGPVLAVGDVGILRARHHPGPHEHRRAVARLPGNHVQAHGVCGDGFHSRRSGPFRTGPPADFFLAGAVVLQEEDQRVVQLSGPAQFGDDPPDPLVHPVDHRRVDLHAPRLPRLVRHAVPIAHLRRQVPIGPDQAQLLQPLETLPPNGLVAAVVFALVLGDLLGRGVHGPMGGRVGHVEEQRLIGPALAVVADEPDGVVGDRVGVVEPGGLVVRVGERGDHRVIARQRAGIVVASRSADRAVESLEAPLERPVVFRPLVGVVPCHVPLAGHAGRVARLAQHFGDRHAAVAQVALKPLQALVLGHVPDGHLLRIEPAVQTRPGRTAPGRVVELAEPQPARSQPVEVRRVDLSTVAPEIGEPHVVGEDHEDIGPGRAGFGGPRRLRGQQHCDSERCESMLDGLHLEGSSSLREWPPEQSRHPADASPRWQGCRTPNRKLHARWRRSSPFPIIPSGRDRLHILPRSASSANAERWVAPIAPAIGVPKAQEACFDQTCRARERRPHGYCSSNH